MLDEALDKLAKACRILEKEGHGDMSLGHVSLRDPQGRGFWLKRNRAGLGEIRGPRDFVLVSFSGEKLSGEGGRHSEWPIHSQILQRRPDVQVVAHTHARERQIAGEAVRSHRGPLGVDDAADERAQVVLEGDALQHRHPRRSWAFSALLDGRGHDGLVPHLPASAEPPLAGGAHVGLVHLHEAFQPMLGPVPERRTHLVQQGPRRLVAAQARVALELEGRDALLVASHEEDRPEPDPQRHAGAVEDRPRRHRGLVVAAPALLEPAARDPVALGLSTPRAPEPVGPAQLS